jgi:Dolichyl-phosphate-mannose-protein mannosyltransferase
VSASRTILIGLVCVAIGTAADALFLPHQSLWLDEAAQMTGLSMGPVDLTKWLTGHLGYETWAPKDRMPPLGYWLGWAWSQVFGFDERSMRWFGVAFIAVATAIVFGSAKKVWGLGSGVAAALLLATSPNVVITSVEIRSYPALILMSSGLFACLVGYVSGPIESRGRWLAGLVACGIGAMYSHFFGLVALGGALVGAFVVAIVKKEKITPVILAGVVAGLASLGLAPFVMASYGLSAGLQPVPDSGGKMIGLVKMGYRFFAHPSTSVSKVAVGLAALGFALGIACGFARKRQAGSVALALILALASGLAVVTLAHLGQSSFEATSANYNMWVLPPLAMLIASGLAAEARAVRVASLAAIVMTIAANTYAVGQLSIHGDAFAHTSYGPIANLLRGYDPAKVAVIHDDDAEVRRAFAIYVPMRYEFGPKVRQFFYNSGGQDGAGVELTEYPDLKAKCGLDDLPFDDLIVVRSQDIRAVDIASQIHHGIVPLGDGPVTKALLASGKWERIAESTYLSFHGADVDVFRKVARP